MKKIYKSMLVAFGTFSRIPLPPVSLDETDGEFSMCFFPMVGLVIGIMEYTLFMLSLLMGFPVLLRCALLAVLPLVVTGGIHMDGFVDVSDAMNSYQSIEKKLEILKDPHIGAFGVIKMMVYMVVMLGLLSCISNRENALLFSVGFVISRAFTAITVVTFKNAKNTGMGYTEKNNSKKNAVVASAVLWILVTFFVGIYDIYAMLTVLVMLAIMLVWFFMYRRITYKTFGGFTGDTSGWFLMNGELIMLAVIVLINFL